MSQKTTNGRMLTKLFFRLLPIQVLLCVIGAINGIVSSLFAGNYIGAQAMSAVGLYAPLLLFITAVSTMLVGGSQILCGKYMGANQVESTRRIFSLNIAVTVLLSAIMIAVIVIGALTGLTRIFTDSEEVRHIFSQYLLGQAIGVLPLMLGSQLAAFLSLENNVRRTIVASVAYIIINIVLNFLFVGLLRMEAFGLALASSLGLWVYLAIQAQYFVSGKSLMRFDRRLLRWREAGDIFRVGVPGAASSGYQAVRGFIVNALIVKFVGDIGLSSFAASDAVLRIFWALPCGMVAVSRMLMSISAGEEDRQSLHEEMRIGMFKCTALQLCVSLAIVILAVPLTRLYFRDPADPVYSMTVWGFRLLPLCMPLSIAYMHFTCYAQISNKQTFVHILALLDGVVCVAGFSALLIPFLRMNGVYLANILNGVVTVAVGVGYAWLKKKRFPRNMDDLMVIPENFGAAEDDRMDLTVQSMEDVVRISQSVQAFCLRKGIDERRSYLAGLFLEEMAGNVVSHGFTKDKKKHTADIRAVHKDGGLILRIKDDCVSFDPAERQSIAAPDDVTKNIGIRMVYAMAEDISYQNILGLNVLTIRI